MKQVIRFTSMLAASAGLVLMGFATLASPARADELVGCDTVRVLGNNWRATQTARNVGVVACTQVPTGAVIPAGQNLLVEFRVTSGAFDVFAIPNVVGVGAAANAQLLTPAAVFVGSGLQVLTVAPPASGFATLAVAPSVDGTRGSYTLRLRAGGAAPLVPTSIPLPPNGLPTGAIILPTTTNQACSTAGVNLSDLCIDPYPAPTGGTTYAVWRIANFRNGSFDRGDGQGFSGPIAGQQRVDIPGMTAPRVVRLQWTDLQGRTYIDSILVPIGGQPAAQPTLPPVADTFPCSRSGLGVSNLCIEQPFPVRRGTTAYAVWRIQTGFQTGAFDRGDGQGLRGPITAEQRVEISNITGPRTITLQWVDGSGATRTDSFTIQVVD